VGTVIRRWQKSDFGSIRRITWQSWVSTYSSFIPERDLTSYFDIHYTEASLLSIFDDPFTQVFIAEVDDQIAGFARLFFNRDENRLYISSLYLLPEFEGKGIGMRLLEWGEEYAIEKGLDELWIGVMVKNRQALLFYRKMGFQFVREEPFTMGKTTVSHLIGYKKSGRGTLLNQKTYTAFDGGRSLSGLCLEFLSEEKKAWLDLQDEHAGAGGFLWSFVDGRPVQNRWARYRDAHSGNLLSPHTEVTSDDPARWLVETPFRVVNPLAALVVEVLCDRRPLGRQGESQPGLALRSLQGSGRCPRNDVLCPEQAEVDAHPCVVAVTVATVWHLDCPGQGAAEFP